jgi:uncharacterized membrane protein YgcG
MNEHRTYTIVYRARGWVKRSADDKAVVVRATPWGSEWKGTLGQLRAVVQLPKDVSRSGDVIQVFGAGRGAAVVRTVPPVGMGGRITFGLTGSDIAPGERVELLATIPVEAAGITVNLPAESETADELNKLGNSEQAASHDREEFLNSLSENRTMLILGAALAALLLSGLWVYLAWRRDMREIPWPDDVGRIAPNPPSELEPALAVSLVEQREGAAPTALVATIFDLIRRDAWKVIPAQSDERGAEVDIALKPAGRPSNVPQTDFERRALELVDQIIGDDENGVSLGAIKSKLKSDLSLSHTVAATERTFESDVTKAVGKHQWFQKSRFAMVAWPMFVSFLVLVASIASLIFHTRFAWAIGSDPRTVAIVAATAVVASLGMFITLLLPATSRLLRTRWRAEARHDAAQWTAYRDFLDDYGDMQDEQTASIEIWERHLVYAIAFGCADDILKAVRPQGAAEKAASATSLAAFSAGSFSSFNNGIHARAPEPSSSGGGSSSFGGGGGGFGGGGGGGGGAW